MTEIVATVLVGIGVFFMFVASLGVLRLPGFYMRVHAPTKAVTLGLSSLLAAAAVGLGGGAVTYAVLIILVVGFTVPVGTLIVVRAAYRCGVPIEPGTRPDEYGEHLREGGRPGAAPKPASDLESGGRPGLRDRPEPPEPPDTVH